MTDAPSPRTATELAARLMLEHAGQPFLLVRDGESQLQLIPLPAEGGSVTVGRDRQNDVALPWDAEISRVHAELVPVGTEWLVADQGMSRNGTFLNGRRITGRHRLTNGDVLRVGQTLLAVAIPAGPTAETTLRSPTVATVENLTAMQRAVLVELCRPLISGGPGALPASNQDIADAVSLSLQGVKSQLRTLTERFGYADLPQNRKRLALAERAVRLGLGGARPSGP